MSQRRSSSGGLGGGGAGGGGSSSLISSRPFRILVGLLLTALLIQAAFIVTIVSHPGAVHPLRSLLRKGRAFRRLKDKLGRFGGGRRGGEGGPSGWNDLSPEERARLRPGLLRAGAEGGVGGRTRGGHADRRAAAGAGIGAEPAAVVATDEDGGAPPVVAGAKGAHDGGTGGAEVAAAAIADAAAVAVVAPESDAPTDRFPYLPPFAAIPDADRLANLALEGKPTVAGVASVMYRFLHAQHDWNARMHGNKSIKPEEVLGAFGDLVSEILVPFDAVYQGGPIFPIRDDDSIFVSLASYRDYLLGETMRELFGRAKHPERLYVGAVVQNCFGNEYQCRTGVEVVGKDKQGRPQTKVSDAPPDKNGVEEFCEDDKYKHFCESGQVRALYVNETESVGPAMARYFASKLWGGESFFMQVDSHLQFVEEWDRLYVEEVKATKAYPKAVLSTYPPGFGGLGKGESRGSRLCSCEFSHSDVEEKIIRIGLGGSYRNDPPRPTQIPFIAAGFFFARGEFLVDVPFDPYLPWCFMGEEIALSMRAWTSGWDIYAPRKNYIAHQYRPGRMGLPKFWESVGRQFGRPGPTFSNRIQKKVIQRVKNLVGYLDMTKEFIESEGDGKVLSELENYGIGKSRTRDEYLKFANIDMVKQSCGQIGWCSRSELE